MSNFYSPLFIFLSSFMDIPLTEIKAFHNWIGNFFKTIFRFNGTQTSKHIMYLKDGNFEHYYFWILLYVDHCIVWGKIDLIENMLENSFINRNIPYISFNILIFLKNIILAYLSREYNVIAVDWERLTNYPCYLTSLANTKLVSQCTAQVIIKFVLINCHVYLNFIVFHTLAVFLLDLYRNWYRANIMCWPFFR